MDQAIRRVLRIGSWRVDPTSGCISQAEKSVRLDGRAMTLLMVLADRSGEVVGVEELLDKVWAGVIVTQDSVYQAVASLRRLLGDDAKQPAYIATVPRLGYRLVAPVRPWVDEIDAPSATNKPDPIDALPSGRDVDLVAPVEVFTVAHDGLATIRRDGRTRLYVVLVVLALAAVASWYGLVRHAAASAIPARSVAVMPILDLTSEQMNEEYFADGVTEELIDRLSKIPGMRVPSPASSFYFKDKNVTVAQFAKSLGVAYVLSGSLRKSGTTQRISARLVRAGDGYIVWTQSYDRPATDELKVQDDIAGHVAAALSASIR
jgi:TolB-like protein/DNA-binding winged helix-turn-helix (wHTH) protein